MCTVEDVHLMFALVMKVEFNEHFTTKRHHPLANGPTYSYCTYDVFATVYVCRLIHDWSTLTVHIIITAVHKHIIHKYDILCTQYNT